MSEIKVVKENGLSLGHTCPACGKYHKWSMYVFAHYDIKVKHICECGQQVQLLSGTVTGLKDGE